MKTIEELWGEAQQNSSKTLETPEESPFYSHVNAIIDLYRQANTINDWKQLKDYSKLDNRSEIFLEDIKASSGQILYDLACISKYFNFNIFEELQKVIDDESRIRNIDLVEYKL